MAEAAPRKEAAPRRKVTINTLMAKMRRGEQITQLAAYDYRTAVISDRLGMDILCVSDTGGMILFGHQSTVTVSFDEVMMMAKAIDRGSKYGLRMVDMPYWSFHVSKEQAVANAGRFVHEANAEVMKCEGNRHHAKNIEAIVQAGIPVQGHIGITPMPASSPRARRHSGRRSWWTTRRPSWTPAASRFSAKSRPQKSPSIWRKYCPYR